jgi:hypothetical protein
LFPGHDAERAGTPWGRYRCTSITGERDRCGHNPQRLRTCHHWCGWRLDARWSACVSRLVCRRMGRAWGVVVRTGLSSPGCPSHRANLPGPTRCPEHAWWVRDPRAHACATPHATRTPGESARLTPRVAALPHPAAARSEWFVSGLFGSSSDRGHAAGSGSANVDASQDPGSDGKRPGEHQSDAGAGHGFKPTRSVLIGTGFGAHDNASRR